MRVMLLAPGSSIHSQRNLLWLENAGCEVIFVDFTEPPSLNARTSFVSYPSGILEMGRVKLYNRRIRWLRLHYLWRRYRPDIVHLHWVDWRAYDCHKARLYPLVLTCWGSDINQHFEPNADPTYAKSTGQAIASADYVFADAAEVTKRCQRLAGGFVPGELLLLGVNTDHFRSVDAETRRAFRQQLDIPEDSEVLLSVRAWKREHRHELILEAFAQAQQCLSRAAYLVFNLYNVEDDRYEEEVRKRAVQLGILQYVRWIQGLPHKRMPELYAMADVVLNFPLVDAFPVSFIEAAASGKLVISSDLLAYHGMGLDDFCSFVDKDIVSDLTRAIIDFFGEPLEKTLAKSEQARRWAQRVGDERISTSRLLERYRDVIRHGHRK